MTIPHRVRSRRLAMLVALPVTLSLSRLRRVVLGFALVVAVAGSLLAGAPARASAATATVNTGLEWQFFDLLNAYRAANHEPALRMSSGSTAVARPWSAHMAATSSLQHNPSFVSQLAAIAPNWTTVGENVGYGYSAATLNQAFINSPPHRANMVGSGYNYVGIGAVTSGSTIWVTFDFVGTSTAIAQEPRPVVAPAITTDFTGSGYAAKAVYRPSTGMWYVPGRAPLHWGARTDLPVPGHYSGGSAALPALFRPSTGQWFFWGLPTVYFGQAGDVPVPGDYDGDGRTDIALFRPSNGTWYVRGHAAVHFGQVGDVPVPAAYDGGRAVQIALWRPADGTWYVYHHAAIRFGQRGDIPIPGQYDGGAAEIAVYRTGIWYVRGHAAVPYGAARDVPVPAVFLGGRTTQIAIWRPYDGGWYVHNHATVLYGAPGDTPLH